ncbi:MAG: hypothetical protein R2744_12140 [Bacteroidales bacterium]
MSSAVTPPEWELPVYTVAGGIDDIAYPHFKGLLSRTPSFEEAIAICECSSMIPGVRCIPVASTTLAPFASRPLPTLLICRS